MAGEKKEDLHPEVPKVRRKPYGGKYPSIAELLISEGICSPPKQYEAQLNWATGINIVYNLHNMTPAKFKEHSDTLLLLAFQEGERYKEYKWKFAGFDVKLGRLPKGKDLAEEVTFQAAMAPEAELMVYGEKYLGYEVPQKFFLIDKAEDILDIASRYMGKVSKQTPYKVSKMFISIREPKWEYTPAGHTRPESARPPGPQPMEKVREIYRQEKERREREQTNL